MKKIKRTSIHIHKKIEKQKNKRKLKSRKLDLAMGVISIEEKRIAKQKYGILESSRRRLNKEKKN